ncbi:MAG TPA: hypothetical protein VK694_04665 [Verrucomicrobiae bacterium]|nr:hypothetical protein [Verrucomicrobiae bacterium]
MSSHEFDRDAWAELDIFNQMGNIGSEVGRALAAKRQGKTERMQSAFFRGMDLINATVDVWSASHKTAVPELLCARELFAESILTDKVDATLEKYFMQFAIAARLQR